MTPELAEATSSPVLTVAKRGDRDAESISEAIERAVPGTRFVVRPGTYRESLVLGKDVEVIADGAVTVISDFSRGHSGALSARSKVWSRRCCDHIIGDVMSRHAIPFGRVLEPVPRGVERMYLLVGLALLLWTSVGRAVEKSQPKVRLMSKTKGARLSLARIGSYYWTNVVKQWRLTTRFVREHLPPPRLRMFKWLMAPQN